VSNSIALLDGNLRNEYSSDRLAHKWTDPCCTRFCDSISSKIRVLLVAASRARFPSELVD
jgi:hypothetical protein